MQIELEQARPEQAPVVAEILQEAAAWAERRHGRLWVESELDPDSICADVGRGEFFLAPYEGVYAGTVRYQLVDELFWPDATPGEAAYVHRLAVRRAYAGRGLAAAMLHWAARRAREEGRLFLRLDTDITRPKLRDLYERCGFAPHSERQVGPYRVMRYERRLERRRR